jgi:DNA polymerase-4
VEQNERPELRGRPVGVVPIVSDYTSIIATSREAKARGVRGIVSVQEARRLAPDITIVEARPNLYVKINQKIVALIDRIVPVLSVRSIDELVADVSGWTEQEIEIRAQRIKADLAREIGACVTCSIGAAPNELLAKIAAEINKPDGLLLLRPEDLPGPLLNLALRDIPGIARGMEHRLARAGIFNMTQLWDLAPKHARAIWGGVEGERFWAQLHGYAVERPPTQKSMYGHSRVLARDWRNRERAYACARLLTIKAARRMRREGFSAGAFMLGLRGGHGEPGWFQEIRLKPAADDHAFLDCLSQAWPSVWPRGAKVVSITLCNLTPMQSVQSDLFTTPAEIAGRARWLKIAGTLDALNKRYGRAIVSMGPHVEPPGGYAGAKIAFGRIPDLEDF